MTGDNMTSREAAGPGGKSDPWTDEIEAEIFDRIANGGAVRNILKDDWLPSAGTFYRRLDADAAFAERYARAKEQLADTIFEECLTIADSQEGDVYKRDGVDVVNHDAIARAKLRIDTRKWMAGKLRPKVYGDKITNEHTGADGGPIQTQEVSALERITGRIAGIAARSRPEEDPSGTE